MAPTSSTGGESCGPSAMKAAGMGVLANYRLVTTDGKIKGMPHEVSVFWKEENWFSG